MQAIRGKLYKEFNSLKKDKEIFMTIRQTHLDNFREVYTLNFKNEKRSDNNKRIDQNNVFKMLMWVPIVSQFIAVILFHEVRKAETKIHTDMKIAIASRAAIAFIVPPLLIPIDLVGTALKGVIDARNKKIAKQEI